MGGQGAKDTDRHKGAQMQDTLKRYFKIFLGVAGTLLSGAIVTSGLKTGSVLGLGQMALVMGTAYQRAAQTPQYWFIIFFWSAVCASCAWLAWASYRE